MPRLARAGVCVGLVAVVLASAAGGELPRHLARPKARLGIPGYDYRYSQVTPPATVTAVSLEKIDATPPALPNQPRRPATYVYQFRESRLQVDHCFLSRVAVAVHEDGFYDISFRADQNPQPGEDIRSPLKPGERLETTLQTTHLKRNLFVVKVRGYAAAPVDRDRTNVASPVVVEFPVMEFMVQRGEPVSKSCPGYSDAVRKYFPLIDRVEVEFTYR